MSRNLAGIQVQKLPETLLGNEFSGRNNLKQPRCNEKKVYC
jgi:hypothetical protein